MLIDKRGRRRAALIERLLLLIFILAGFLLVLALGCVCLFVLRGGSAAADRFSVSAMLLGDTWKPSAGQYGLLPMLAGSAMVVFPALLFGVPCGFGLAIWLVWYCPRRLYDIFKPATELLAGIPSVVYGFWGMETLLPLMHRLTGSGMCALTAGLLLGLMLTPTAAGLAEATLRALPQHIYSGARALGADREQSIIFGVLPAARQGLASAAMLALGRAVGESMAVIMVAGNQARLPHSLLDGVRTLAAGIALEAGYASGDHRDALYFSAALLLCISLMLGAGFSLLSARRSVSR
ncbi:MAG: phosphate ABC transporter permease subunit PstC [Ruminococcaceae bacterium]|nr:phosphate ABC transporter permease subunit PstC [Oscillospiraceae bacterium]